MTQGSVEKTILQFASLRRMAVLLMCSPAKDTQKVFAEVSVRVSSSRGGSPSPPCYRSDLLTLFTTPFMFSFVRRLARTMSRLSDLIEFNTQHK